MILIPYYLESDKEGRPWLTRSLIAFNVAVWMATESMGKEWILLRWGYKPAMPGVAEVFTSMILHGHWLHLLGNMYFLWVFGSGLERELGKTKPALIYVVSHACGVVMHGLFLPSAMADIPAVGASAAISGIMGAVAVAMAAAPLHCVLFRVRAIKMPSALMLVGWFLYNQVLSALFHGPGQVAVWGHIGGFAAGALMALLLWGVPELGRRRQGAARRRRLEDAFAVGGTPPEEEGKTADERLAAGILAGRIAVEQGITAASAHLNPKMVKWDGRATIRAMDALSDLGLKKEALAAARRRLEAGKGDAAEAELLLGVHGLLRSVKKNDAAATFSRVLQERYPDSIQARQLSRTLTQT